MNFSEALNQTLEEFNLSAKAIALGAGIREATLSEYRNGKRQIQTDNLERLIQALPSEAKQYLLFKRFIGEMDQVAIATLLSAIAHYLKEDNPQNSSSPPSSPVLSLMRG